MGPRRVADLLFRRLGMIRSEKVNRAVGVALGVAALLAMTLAWSGVSVTELLRAVLK